MESVFAEYQRDMLEEFDLFVLDASYESSDYSEEKIFDRLSYYGASGMEQTDQTLPAYPADIPQILIPWHSSYLLSDNFWQIAGTHFPSCLPGRTVTGRI